MTKIEIYKAIGSVLHKESRDLPKSAVDKLVLICNEIKKDIPITEGVDHLDRELKIYLEEGLMTFSEADEIRFR